MNDNLIKIQISYPKKNYFLELMVSQNTNIQQILEEINFFNLYPEARDLKIGIFSKIKPLNYILLDNDRIEIYSPLIADPKEQRQKRIEKKRIQDKIEKNKQLSNK